MRIWRTFGTKLLLKLLPLLLLRTSVLVQLERVNHVGSVKTILNIVKLVIAV